MSPATALERLKTMVVARTGHHYYHDKDKLIYDRARECMQAAGVTSFEAFVAGLERGEAQSWRRFEDAITVGETYFFRYPDHFASLRGDVLPRLIRARADTRSLRIWSIGCSNGAETYSLAIVLREVLGVEIDSWRISLIGGDISEKALSSARAARYNNWALRTMSPEDRDRYFHRDGALWVLKREYRSMARFERQNLLDLVSPAPPLEWTGFDLILCRNVLIYFSPQQAIQIADELAKCVAADGALFLGHVEATLAGNPGLRTVALSELTSEYAQAMVPPASLPDNVLPALPPLPVRPLTLLRPGQPGPAITVDDANRLQQLADAGAYEEAEQLCGELLLKDPTSARLHYYDAILHQVTDDLSGAEAALRRALYLDRSFILAHHRLGILLVAQGRAQAARRSLQSAVRLADAARVSDLVPEGQGISAGELAATLRQQLEVLDSA